MEKIAPIAPSHSPSPPQYKEVEDWEDWESESVVTPIEQAEQVLINTSNAPTGPGNAARISMSKSNRLSISKLNRLRSRKRQRAQNAMAGITVITDMTALRKQSQQANGGAKFVDAAALRALEGDPSSASVGNWNWLRKARGQTPISASPQNPARAVDQELSPEDRPIVIGISLPSDAADSREISPQTAVITTPSNPLGLSNNNPSLAPNKQPAQTSTKSSFASSQSKSVWSPDTPDTASSFNSPQRAVNLSPQAAPQVTSAPVGKSLDAALPAGPKKSHHQRLISLELGANGADDDDGGTPCTLFEEDGIPSPSKSTKPKMPAMTPDSAGSKIQGWWDHVTTPFMEKRLSFSNQKHRLESPREEDEDAYAGGSRSISGEAASPPRQKPLSILIQAPIVRAPTPRRTPSPRPPTSLEPSATAATPSTAALNNSSPPDKPQIIVTDSATTLEDGPPPYSPPKKQQLMQQDPRIRYRAVFPPGHPLHAQFPPSPGPVSPGLAAAMTSQGATQMTEIPITPSTRGPAPVTREMPLPSRPAGAYLPGDHVHDAPGRANKKERQRRRHEKEEVIARRLGGFWRGRGCIPATGCFGRAGREGRKRRRVWIGILSALLALIILGVVLGVVLTRPQDSQEVESIWVNLTDFPPMPTGVLTVVAPDNNAARSSCTSPSTLWSCALPKEQHESVAPAKPNQPTIVMQIQWDNGTDRSWDVQNGKPPASAPRRARGVTSLASSLMRARQAGKPSFEPIPKPPTFEEMWFLGDTTDDVKSEEKAGEPTPFYISLLDSVNAAVDTPSLSRRQSNEEENGLLRSRPSQPELEDDGTPKPARLLPLAKQQPLRLYDRGLATEHYGFYMHYKRTIYLRSITAANATDDEAVPLDENGGCRKTEAGFLVTWAETRLLMRIWTRNLDSNTSSLIKPTGDNDSGGEINPSLELVRPGTMPYPVTTTIDSHGGDKDKSVTWAWPMDARQNLDLDKFKYLANKRDVGGTHINKGNSGDAKFGGFNGGTGGCKCEWMNWVERSSGQ